MILQARIRKENGTSIMEVNGKALSPMAFTPHAFTRDVAYLRQLGEAGISVFFLICDLPWINPRAMEQLEEDTAVLVEAVPNAHIFLRLGMHPPASWVDAHPDEQMQYNDGETIECDIATESYQARYSGMYAMYSHAWRKDAGEELLRFMEQLQTSPYIEHYIGVFFAAGNTSEWYPATRITVRAGEYAGYNMDSAVAAGILPDLKAQGAPHPYDARSATQTEPKDMLGDTSPAFRREFTRLLKQKYGDEDTLRRQWNDPSASLEDPPIPGLDERFFTDMEMKLLTNIVLQRPAPQQGDTNVGVFLNADKYQYVADFYRALHVGVAHTIIHFGQLIKEHFPQYLTGSFYGYFGTMDYYNMTMCAGGLDILNSGYVDILACPNIYIDRQPGALACQRVLQDSFRLRGRAFFSEDDTRTHLDGFYRDSMRVYDVLDSINVMKRDFGRDLCEDIYGWWFDQLEWGRYKSEPLYALMGRQQKIAKAAYSNSRVKKNDIAVLYDEVSVHYVTQGVSAQINEVLRTMELPRIGAPVDYYYQNDLALDEMPDYKLYIFMNCFALNDESRKAIERKIKKRGATALFLYAQGLINPDRCTETGKKLDVCHVEELTGIRMTRRDEAMLTSFRVDTELEAFSGIDSRKIYGVVDRTPLPGCALVNLASPPYVCPVFIPEDEDAQILGRFASTNEAALTMKTVDGFTSVFSGTYWLSADVMRAVAKQAGCHIYQEQGDYLFANETFVTVHAKTGGTKTLHFKKACTPYEVYEGKVYAENTDTITFEMQEGDTKMFCVSDSVREELECKAD